MHTASPKERAADPEPDLTDRTVIVTGAAGGIGRATALKLAQYGANIVATDKLEEAAATADAICSAGGKAKFVACDVGVEESVRELVAKTVEAFGRLNGAFNNAGVEQCSKALHDLSAAEWERALTVDLTGVFYCIKHQVIVMLKSGGGAIVNTASALGMVAIPNAAEYIAAKHGVVGLTRAAAADYGAHGIRVNAVLPGIIETPMISRLANDQSFSAFFDKLRDRHPIGRFGRPEEIGEVVSWLLSDSASFVTGSAISADGGYLAI